MITIYASKAPVPALKGVIRDIRPVWLLEEIGVPYEHYFLSDEEFDSEWYGKINPFRRVPSLKDGDFTMTESVAITLYLADKFQKLTPPKGSIERTRLDQWMFAIISYLETYSTRIFSADFFSEKTEFDLLSRKEAIEALDRVLPVFEQTLQNSPYLMGDEFNVADILFSCVMRITWHSEVSKKYPTISKYLEKNYARPAFQRAYAKNAG